MRWARAIACRSFWGFQSLSKIMTVSADTRFRPSPPALVLRSMMKRSKDFLLKRPTAAARDEADLDPSSRSNLYSRRRSRSSRRSRTLTIWLKIKTLCPPDLSLGSNLSSKTIFPLDLMSCSPVSLLKSTGAAEAVGLDLNALSLDPSVLASASFAAAASAKIRSSAPPMRKGWLQHFRSSMAAFIRLGAFFDFGPLKRNVVFFSYMAL
mmetsp:Transcript_13024/g.28187  ORF Transcript_13024/g.28187 Transcript_13024/m.28187 type:complete len:209 (+) Transcript_13024:3980-4606(+)